METYFVKTRSELTDKLNELKQQGYTCYRVRVPCGCDKPLKNPDKYPHANQRNGVLVIDDDNRVISLYIRCNVCSKPESERY